MGRVFWLFVIEIDKVILGKEGIAEGYEGGIELEEKLKIYV